VLRHSNPRFSATSWATVDFPTFDRLPAGVPGERAVFVGDTAWDMKVTVRGGATPVGASGGIPRADLESAGARTVYRDPADLLEHLGASVFADRE